MAKRKHIVFVSEELHPLTAGGLGRFVFNALEQLNEYFEITVIIPNITDTQLEGLFSKISFSLNIVTDSVEFVFPYWNEKGAYYLDKIVELHEQKPIDYVEFYDFGGSALETLLYRQSTNKLKDIKIFIRHHMTIGEITEVETPFIPNHFVFYITQREQEALHAADGVLAQSKAYSKKINNDTFISYPPVSKLKSFYNVKENIENGSNILYFGKLQQCKNIEVLLDALVFLLQEGKVNFHKCLLVGNIVPYSFSGYANYHEELLSRIPVEFQDKFLFLGAWELEKLPEIAKNAKLAVIPSKIESFCLSAHELASFGIPLVLKDIGAYHDFVQEHEHCEFFKESYIELASKIELLWNGEKDLIKMSEKLSSIKYPDFSLTYSEILALPIENHKKYKVWTFQKNYL